MMSKLSRLLCGFYPANFPRNTNGRRGGAGALSVVWIVLLFLTLTPPFSGGVYAQSGEGERGSRAKPFVWDGKGVRYPLATAELLEDPSGRMNVERVMSSRDFRPVGQDRLNLGYTNSVIWVRLKLKIRAPRSDRLPLLEIPYPQTDQVDLYTLQGEAPWLVHKRLGDLHKFSSRHIPHRNFVFVLDRPSRADDVMTFYLRFESQGALFVALRLLGAEDLTNRMGLEQFVFGLYYGITLIIIFLYAFIAYTEADRSSFYYVLHILAFALFQMSVNGLISQYVWPNSPEIAHMTTPLFGGLGAVFGIWFGRAFLETRVFTPFLDQVMGFLSALIWLALLSGLFIDYSIWARSITILSGLFTVLLMAAGIRVVIRGFRPARFFLAGWIIFLPGILFYNFFLYGFAPSFLAGEFAIQIGSVVQMFILSLAIIDRISILRRERERAQRVALEEQRKQVSLREDLNRRLENEVEQKTAELSLAFEKLKKRDQELQKELELASDIQRELLPGKFLEFQSLRVASFHRYMTRVGGDYYDIYRMPDGSLGFLIADVSGHGIPAALVTSMAKIAYMDSVRIFSNPADINRNVNTELVKSISPLAYLTAFFFTVNKNLEVRYSGAGHSDPLVLRRATNEVHYWSGKGFVIGMMADMGENYFEVRQRLYEGDRVLLYTDGITEARNTSGEEFGAKRLEYLLLGTARMSIDRARIKIREEYYHYVGESEVEDDVSFMLIEIDRNCRPQLDNFQDNYEPDNIP